MTVLFESYDSMWLQLHEMLRVEKGGESQIPGELEAYNSLIPKGDERVATFLAGVGRGFHLTGGRPVFRFSSGAGEAAPGGWNGLPWISTMAAVGAAAAANRAMASNSALG